jgi:molybdopterin molybdotransferase
MISVEKATKTILNDITLKKSERLGLDYALFRVLSKNITAGRNVPSFLNSAMDGYALRSSDTRSAKAAAPVIIKVIGEARAGKSFSGKVTKGACVSIMTGAMLPDGADCVVKAEDVKQRDGFLYIKKPIKKSEYVRFPGEDIKKGDIVLSKGKRLMPADIGILSSLKRGAVSVYKKPTVAILCTGDELVDIDVKLKPGMVVSSNLYSLFAHVQAAGCEAVSLGLVNDDKKALKRKLKRGLKYDFLITSGGISVGDYDFVKESLQEIGAVNRVCKVLMRPGKPFSYFTHGSTKIFALPGNPVSCNVTYLLFVRPALLKAKGESSIFLRSVDAVLKEDINKIRGYKFFIRGIIKKDKDGYQVRPTGPQESSILKSMSLANGLIIADSRRTALKKEEKVKVIVLDDGFDCTVPV